MRAALLVCVALVLSVAVAGCFGSGTQSSSSPTSGARPTTSSNTTAGVISITLQDHSFENGNRTIAPGTAAVFTNEGVHKHTVTIHHVGDPPNVQLFNQTLEPGQKATFPFVNTGTYHVWCRFHGTMTSGMAMVMTVSP